MPNLHTDIVQPTEAYNIGISNRIQRSFDESNYDIDHADNIQRSDESNYDIDHAVIFKDQMNQSMILITLITFKDLMN